MTRAENVARIQAIRHERPDLTSAQQAASVGMTLSAYRNLVTDPDGAKQRARREGYKGVCESCGGETRCSGTSHPPRTCAACWLSERHENRTWTQAAIVASFQAFKDETGRTPTVTDNLGRYPSMAKTLSPTRLAELAATQHIVLPHVVIVQREFGSWSAAVRASGLEPAPTGRPGHREHKRKAA